ncbi:hypothetical protein TSAR_005379 [Trichomalopsis sarcophagae]|uniref:Uncharacterized protein n=1 Tax=Trichomalopsis sarcophagae TaxID=543379 RepID=A0A232EK45_9HYME|nr:hypothetical protein TSAR_005379 [Trichomalopsis sarcophagae]
MNKNNHRSSESTGKNYVILRLFQKKTLLPPWTTCTSETVPVAIFVFSDLQKPQVTSFDELGYSFPAKLKETTLILGTETTLTLSTLDTRYLGDRCRRDIRVQQPQKPPSSETGFISFNIY